MTCPPVVVWVVRVFGVRVPLCEPLEPIAGWLVQRSYLHSCASVVDDVPSTWLHTQAAIKYNNKKSSPSVAVFSRQNNSLSQIHRKEPVREVLHGCTKAKKVCTRTYDAVCF
jgi:hypothetical protein